MISIPDNVQQQLIIKALLHRIGIFEHLGDQELRLIIDRLVRRPIRTGEVVVRQGEPGSEFFVMVAGKVGVYREWWKFRRRVATRGPDECFGEMALIDDAPRYYTVQSDEEGEVLVLAREDFQQVLMNNPESRRALQEIADFRRAPRDVPKARRDGPEGPAPQVPDQDPR